MDVTTHYIITVNFKNIAKELRDDIVKFSLEFGCWQSVVVKDKFMNIVFKDLKNYQGYHQWFDNVPRYGQRMGKTKEGPERYLNLYIHKNLLHLLSLVKMATPKDLTIPAYYKDKSIFITGGSGFMGQALVEKLLYSCPELDSIYLLMRGKKGVPPEERLEKLYSSSCFDRLRVEKPTIFMEKVHAVSGDVLDLELGLSEEDKSLLINKVNIVFHAAASVRFDDPLKYAVKSNIRGTREIIELSKKMENLTSFVYVSTCYSNTNHDVIDEVLYPPLADWRELLEVCETFQDDMAIQVLTSKYLNGMPNTYVFTKQLAEHLVSEQRGRLPVVIIRPSIVTSSMEEPAPGWINNFNGPVGLSVAIATGLRHSLYANKDINLNYVPLDICIRSFIVIAWARGIVKLRDNDDVQIYNCCVSEEDAINVGDYGGKSSQIAKTIYPYHNTLWAVKAPIFTTIFALHFIITLFCCIIPAVFIDITLLFLGKQARFVKLQRRLLIADLILNYYCSCKQWILKNEKFLKVCENITKEDRETFYYSSVKLYDSDYLDRAVLGAKKYLLNEDINDMSKAKAYQFRMNILDRVIKIIFYGYILWSLINTTFVKDLYTRQHVYPTGAP